MKAKYVFLGNIVLTCATMSLLIFSCSGCTPEQVQKAVDIIEPVHQTIDAAPLEVKSQPWYIFVMLAADIASSIAAGVIAYIKRPETASVDVSKK
jgi:hypothetical protein